ncbi:hypothetical protein Tco_0732498 [Tanacetum coccineum]
MRDYRLRLLSNHTVFYEVGDELIARLEVENRSLYLLIRRRDVYLIVVGVIGVGVFEFKGLTAIPGATTLPFNERYASIGGPNFGLRDMMLGQDEFETERRLAAGRITSSNTIDMATSPKCSESGQYGPWVEHVSFRIQHTGSSGLTMIEQRSRYYLQSQLTIYNVYDKVGHLYRFVKTEQAVSRPDNQVVGGSGEEAITYSYENICHAPV